MFIYFALKDSDTDMLHYDRTWITYVSNFVIDSAYSNIKYHRKAHIELKSREMSFTDKLFLRSSIVLIFRTFRMDILYCKITTLQMKQRSRGVILYS